MKLATNLSLCVESIIKQYGNSCEILVYRRHQVWRSTNHNHVCQDGGHRKHRNHHTAHAKTRVMMECLQ